MEVTLGIAVASLVVALGSWLTPADASWRGWISSAAWAGLVAAMGAAFSGHAFGGGVALSAAAFAAAAALPMELPGAWGARTRRVAGAAPVALGVAALVQTANTFFHVPSEDPNLVLYAGCWAALAAAVTSAISGASAAEVDPDRPPTSTALVIAACLAGAALIGHARGGLGSGEFSLPLTTDGGPMMWGLAPNAGGAGIFGLHVEALAPGVDAALILAALAALALGVVPGGAKRRVALAGASALGSLGALGALIAAGMSPKLPDALEYTERARALAPTRGVPEEFIERGGFIMGETFSVLWVDILPAVTAMLAALLLSVAVALTQRHVVATREGIEDARQSDREPARVTPVSQDAVGDLLARDLSVRAASFAWLAWMLAALTSWGVFAAYGFASPAEWTALGACLMSAGFAWAHWSAPPWMRRVLPGLIAATLILAAAQAAAFGSPFGMSLFY